MAKSKLPQETGIGATPAIEASAVDGPKAPASIPEDLGARKGRGRIGRRSQLIGLLLVLIVIGAGVLVGRQLLTGSAATTTPAPAAATQTVWQKITAGIRDTGVPKDVALEAFAYLYQVNIPGVTVPAGIAGKDYPTSGTGAMRWVQANWDALSADQQAVINRYLIPGPNDIVVPLTDAPTGSTPSTEPSSSPGSSPGASPSSTTSPTPSSSPSGATGSTPDQLGHRPLAAPLKPGTGTAAAAGLGAPAPAALEAAMNTELMADIARIGPRLNMPILTVGTPIYPRISLELSQLDGGLDLFTTHAWKDHGFYEPCTVTAWKNSWENEQVTSSGGVSQALHAEMTHEVIHCYQNVIWGDPDTSTSMASWITEGTALWLAADDTGIAEPMLPTTWSNGYFKPELPLTNRSYDAFGYYALLDYTGRDLWSLMKPAWTAAATQAQRSNAFIAVLRGDDQDIRDAWATSYLRQDLWGAPWVMHGFGLPDNAQVVRHPIAAQADPGYAGSLQGRANTVLSVNSSAGEVVTVTTTGLANVHDDAGNNVLSFQTQKFCISGECVCPSNTPKAGQTMATQKLTLPFVLALNSPFGGSTYNVLGRKLDDECGLKATPPPNAGPCVGKCAGSNGDPHLLTVNNYRYDFQGAGEFTLLRSKDGSLEVQTRQGPYASVGTAQIATNTAIAAKVGGHRVGVYATQAGMQATLDGATLDITKPTDLGSGARVGPYTSGTGGTGSAGSAGGLEIDFPDGTRVWAFSVGKYGVNAQIAPSANLRATGVGLLGAIVPGGLGVPALPDGTLLPRAADRHARHAALYGRFADAWRVSETSTLFDYDTGKSTATYTQVGFPSDTGDFGQGDLSATQLSAGATACAAITDQGLNDSCVFDVGVSGDSGFVGGYSAVEALYDSGIASPSETPQPQPSSSGTGAPGAVAGAIALAKTTWAAGSAAGPDGKLYFSIEVSGGKAALLAVDPGSGAIVQRVDVPRATKLHFAGGSVWAPGVIVDAHGSDCSVTRFDAQTLAQQATISIPCAAFGPTIVSDGTAVWYEDIGKWDSITGKGAVVVRLDPVTNQPGTSVQLPFINGSWIDAAGAIFVNDPTNGLYGLATAGATNASSMESFGKYSGRVFAAGSGFWAYDDAAHSASYFTSPGAPDATVTSSGTLVGGSVSAAYVQTSGSDGSNQLWTYPADGSAPTQIGTAPTVDGDPLSYSSGEPALTAPNGVARYWLLAPNGTSAITLYLQWLPLH